MSALYAPLTPWLQVDSTIPITISAGVTDAAEAAGDGATCPSIIAAADQALYQAKHQGRNLVVQFAH